MFHERLGGFLGGVGDFITGAIEGIGELVQPVIQTIEQIPGGTESASRLLQELIFGSPQGAQQIVIQAPQRIGAAQIPTFPTAPVSAGGRTLATFVQAMPGGAPVAQQAGLAGLGAGVAGGALLEGLMQLLGGGGAQAAPALFRAGAAQVRPVPRIMRQHPTRPDELVVWEHAGRPVLYSRDLRAKRRVERIARKVRSGRRFR
jgi:hypothetical protein